MNDDGQIVRLAGKDWLWLVVVIVGAAISNVVLIYTQSSMLDHRWQERMVEVTSTLRSDIRDVKNSIPPEWFRKMVEANQSEISKLRDKIDALHRQNK